LESAVAIVTYNNRKLRYELKVNGELIEYTKSPKAAFQVIEISEIADEAAKKGYTVLYNSKEG
jgi:hypothetical protein